MSFSEHITNIHPSQHQHDPDDSDTLVGDSRPLLGGDDDANPHRTITDMLGSFVGSYSRTTMTFMADNISLPSSSYNERLDFPVGRRRMSSETNGSFYGAVNDDLEPDKRSTYSSFTEDHETPIGIAQYDDDFGSPNSRSPLLQPLIPALSIAETAEDYKIDPNSTQSSHVKSTFTQSIFNAINILIGIGILSLPLGFRCAGWVVGLTVFAFCCGLTNYTAKLLAKCMDAHPSAHTYADIGAAAFGNRGRVTVAILFLAELVAVSVALVVLFSDTVASLFPNLGMPIIHLGAFVILTPMVFLPVRNLSYTSLIGIISAAGLVVVVMYDGLSKDERPGSLRDPMDTDIFPSDWKTVPLSFGLIMSGFAGHAIFPTIYKDMAEPKRYTSVVNYTYGITFVVYLLMAASGYAMFGITTMQEITQNIVNVPGYDPLLNKLAVWLIVVNPIAKYALTLNPINLTWERDLLKWNSFEDWCNSGRGRRTAVHILGRCAVSALIVIIAIIFPGFDRVMSLLGAFFSFLISAIFPLACHLHLFGHSIPATQRLFEQTLIIISCLLAMVGTVWSVLPHRIVTN